jgi:hypothetical protein
MTDAPARMVLAGSARRLARHVGDRQVPAQALALAAQRGR